MRVFRLAKRKEVSPGYSTHSPGCCIFVFFFLITTIGLAFSPLLSGSGDSAGASAVISDREQIYRALLAIATSLVAYIVMVRVVEKRTPSELRDHAPLRLLQGLLLGLALISAVVGLVWQIGGINFSGLQTPQGWLVLIFVDGLYAGIAEEIMVRGVLFRLTEEMLGTWGSIALSAIIFGAIHAPNPNATVFSVISIALSAGVLFGAIYAATRSLWICAGTHIAWNVTQGVIFGIPISGNQVTGLLNSEPTGPNLISGGSFGVEASIVTPVLMVIVAVFFLHNAKKYGRIVQPYWKRTTTGNADGERLTFRNASRLSA